MKQLNRMLFCLALCIPVTNAFSASPAFTVFTFKNGQKIGARIVKGEELRNAAFTLVSAFQEQVPSYQQLISVAKSMTAKDRCFNLYSSRFALASIESGNLDGSANSEEFLKNSIASIESVNSETRVTCEAR